MNHPPDRDANVPLALLPAPDPPDTGRPGADAEGSPGATSGPEEPPPPPTEEAPVRVRDVLPDAPVPDGAVVPPGWELSPEGVWRHGADPSRRVPAPVVITARLRDVWGEERLLLAWCRGSRWASHVVGRLDVASNSRVIRLASRGLPVTDRSAPQLVEYLAGFEAANFPLLPSGLVSSRMGWQGDDLAGGFLWGRTHLTEAGARPAVGPAGWSPGAVLFQPADPGAAQLADGYTAAGTADGWGQAVAAAAGHPRVRLAVLASLLPPLLPVVGAANFVVDLRACESKVGS